VVARKGVESLVANKGLLHRGLAFETLDVWLDVLKFSFTCWKFETFEQEMTSKGLLNDENFSCGIDGVRLEKVFFQFVDKYLNVFYDDSVESKSVRNDIALSNFWDRMQSLFKRHLANPAHAPPSEFTLANLKLVLAECLFRVTGGHSQIGDTVAVCLDPSVVNIRIAEYSTREEDEQRTFVAPFEAASIICAVTALTTLPIPKLNTNVSHIFKNHTDAQVVYDEFLLNLTQLSLDIKKDNKKRTWPVCDYDPAYCNISTAV